MRRAGSQRGAGRAIVALTTVVSLLAAAACTRTEERPTAPPDSRAVTLESTDGLRLDGRLFGDGDAGVVLSHMFPADQTSWWDFASALADEGYLVLTYDFRGYCPGGDAGCSEGDKDVPAIWQDVLGAVAFLRSEGATQIALAGASMGGTASLVAASELGSDVAVVVTLSAPTSFEGLEVGPEALTRVTAAKLFVAGAGDGSATGSAQQLYEWSPPPKRVEIVPSDEHGTDLVNGGQSAIVRRLMIGYLEEYLGD